MYSLSSLSAAVKNPELISALAKHFGSQCVVCAIDASLKQNGKKEWEVVIKSGTERTGIDVIEWAKEAVERGAGEILLTSFDRLSPPVQKKKHFLCHILFTLNGLHLYILHRDGTFSGYDVDLLRAVSSAVNVPVIASGYCLSLLFPLCTSLTKYCCALRRWRVDSSTHG